MADRRPGARPTGLPGTTRTPAGRRGGPPIQPGSDARRRGRTPRLSPFRLLAIVGLVVGGALLLYGLVFDRGNETQLGFVVLGLGLLGFACLGLAIVGGLAVVRLGRADDEAAAFWAALFGGLCALGAAGCLAGAFVFLLLAGA